MGSTSRNRCQIVTSMILAFVECLCFAVIVNGWPNLVFVLRDAGLFSQLCPQNQSQTAAWDGDASRTGPQWKGDASRIGPQWKGDHTQLSGTYSDASCAQMDSMFSLCYSLATALNRVATFPIGLIFDKYGFWVTRISATCFFLAGTLMMAFSSEGVTSYLMFPGLILVAIAGAHMIMTCVHLSLEAGDKKSMIATLYSGGMDSGVVIFLAVKLLYENHGIGHMASLLFIAGMWVIVLVNTFAFCPRYKVTMPTPSPPTESREKISVSTSDLDNYGACKGNVKGIDNFSSELNSTEPGTSSPTPSLTPPVTFRDCLRTPLFWLMLIWFSLIQLRFIFFIGSLNRWLTVSTDGDLSLVSHYTNMFSYISFGGLLFSPVVGAITDQAMKRGVGSNTSDPFLKMSKAVAPSIWIGTFLAVAHSVAALFFSDVLVYVILVLFVLLRTFLFGNGHTFVALVFPPHLFGKCMGLIYLIAGAISSLQHALFTWADINGDFQLVNSVLLGVVLISFIFPIYIESAYYCKPRSGKSLNPKKAEIEIETIHF